MGKYINYANIDYIFRDATSGSSSIRDLFSCNLNTETRLSVCHPAEFITRNDSKTHPIHYLAFDSDIRKKFSKYFDMAFNKYVVPNTGYGKDHGYADKAMPIDIRPAVMARVVIKNRHAVEMFASFCNRCIIDTQKDWFIPECRRNQLQSLIRQGLAN